MEKSPIVTDEPSNNVRGYAHRRTYILTQPVKMLPYKNGLSNNYYEM